jgi:single-strand DNA-binding protein
MYTNRVTLIGFLGQDARVASTETGREVVRLSVATTRRYQQDSEWKQKTQWHDCVLYGNNVPYKGKLVKGADVVIEGELTYREYDRTIETGTGSFAVQWPITDVVIQSIVFLDRKRTERRELEGAAVSGSFTARFRQITRPIHDRQTGSVYRANDIQQPLFICPVVSTGGSDQDRLSHSSNPSASLSSEGN